MKQENQWKLPPALNNKIPAIPKNYVRYKFKDNQSVECELQKLFALFSVFLISGISVSEGHKKSKCLWSQIEADYSNKNLDKTR